MATRVYDFLCHNGHRVERFVEADVVEHECECGAMGHKQLSTPQVKLEGLTGAFPGAAMKWERDRESHMRKERKNQEKHGTYK